MKVEVNHLDPKNYQWHGAAEAGEYTLNLIPETEEERLLALRIHKSIEGIKNLPAGAAGVGFHAQPLQHMKPEIPFRLVIFIKSHAETLSR